MNQTVLTKLFLFSGLALFFSGCENFDLFQSEDNLNKKIQTRWTMVPIPHDKPQEYWTFNGGIIYREKIDVVTGTSYDTGTYSISTSIGGAVLDIKDFKLHDDSLIAPWDIVRLDDDILFIATDQNGLSGVTQREFYKQ